MRPSSAALSAYLAANTTFVIIDLYTFLLQSGAYLRYSGWSRALTIPAAAFPTGSLNAGAQQTFTLGPRFGRSKVSTKLGVAPSELDISAIAGFNDVVGSTTFAYAVRQGQFDGATVELDRFYMPAAASQGAPDTSLGAIIWFYGRIAETDIGRSKIDFKVKSMMNLLAEQQMPRRLYQAACSHIFGDAMCGYNRVTGLNAAGTQSGPGQQTVTALTGSTQSQLVTSFAPSPSTAYDQGSIIGVTGQNAGQTRTIARVISGTIYLLKAWLLPVAVNDTFHVLPGCDHTLPTCNATFNNLARYGGQPYIPPPEIAV